MTTKMKKEEICENCEREYDGGYPCPDCGSVKFVKKNIIKEKINNENRKTN